jgi:uncharacterized protein YndB with AHSA1/START domain
VAISAPVDQIFDAVTAPARISEWWTRDGVAGNPSLGGRLEFRFGQPEPSAVMEVTGVRPDRVSWHCVGGASEWVGTDLTFDLSESGGDTVVLFTHAGWRDASEFMAHCSARWAYFLFSLKALVELGKGTPFPNDLKF